MTSVIHQKVKLLLLRHWKKVVNFSYQLYITGYVWCYTLAPTDAPAFVRATANSSTDILVTWNEVPLLDQNGLVTIYEVQYEPNDSFNDPMSIGVMTANVTATELSKQEFVSYRITVRAYTRIGPGLYSDDVFETTLKDRPVSSPSHITSSTSIEVTWGELPPIDQNGIVILYEVSCEALETPGRDITLETLMLLHHTPNKSTPFSPLEGFTTCSIAVRAFTAIGAGPYSLPKHNVITTTEESE